MLSSYENNLESIAAKLEQVIKKVSSKGVSKNAIRSIVDASANLALQLGVQRCRIRLFTAEKGWAVRDLGGKRLMDRNGRNGAENVDGIVELCVAPGVSRLGDGRGDDLSMDITTIEPTEVFLVK